MLKEKKKQKQARISTRVEVAGEHSGEERDDEEDDEDEEDVDKRGNGATGGAAQDLMNMNEDQVHLIALCVVLSLIDMHV